MVDIVCTPSLPPLSVRTFNWFCSLFEASAGQMALTVAECMEQLMERGWQEVGENDDEPV
jgi:hypothetical protein